MIKWGYDLELTVDLLGIKFFKCCKFFIISLLYLLETKSSVNEPIIYIQSFIRHT